MKSNEGRQLQSSQPAAIPTIIHEANPNATDQAILIEPPSVRKLPDYLQRGHTYLRGKGLRRRWCPS